MVASLVLKSCQGLCRKHPEALATGPAHAFRLLWKRGSKDHYATLGIALDASQAEITSAFKRAQTKLNSKEAEWTRAKIQQAHSTLSDPSAKEFYDTTRHMSEL